MKPYADTNFFVAYVVDTPFSESVLSLLALGDFTRGVRLPITHLLRLELVNALQRIVFETKNGTAQFSLSSEFALVAEANFEELCSVETFCRPQTPPTKVVEEIFVELAHRHTAKHGFRTYDILHVASALALGCDTFWSFDSKAKKLAKLEGLKTN